MTFSRTNEKFTPESECMPIFLDGHGEKENTSSGRYRKENIKVRHGVIQLSLHKQFEEKALFSIMIGKKHLLFTHNYIFT